MLNKIVRQKNENDMAGRTERTASVLVRVTDLNYKIKNFGYRFLIFALLFYFCIPFFYYYLYLGWEGLYAFYVSLLLLLLLFNC